MKASVSKINKAFDRMSKALIGYARTCRENGSPIRSVSMSVFTPGHLRVKIGGAAARRTEPVTGVTIIKVRYRGKRNPKG